MTPTFDRLLVKQDAAETSTEEGIIIPEQAVERPFEGEVIAAGPDCSLVKAGDKVLFSRFAGTEVTVQGEQYMLLSETDALVVL